MLVIAESSVLVVSATVLPRLVILVARAHATIVSITGALAGFLLLSSRRCRVATNHTTFHILRVRIIRLTDPDTIICIGLLHKVDKEAMLFYSSVGLFDLVAGHIQTRIDELVTEVMAWPQVM